ncbi:MAG TPA: hypothetical protein VFL51_04310 [Pseudolabrys sp.]|nr:hypothetical protein [Pseudolabrys sp.]
MDHDVDGKRLSDKAVDGDTVVAAIWFAFYLIAITTAITAPLFVTAINFASRLLATG